MPVVRVTADNASSTGNNLEFFVNTGSGDQPVVCLGDNNGYPAVLDLYARPAIKDGMNGVNVSVRFTAPANGNGLAVNVYQDNIPGPSNVIPNA